MHRSIAFCGLVLFACQVEFSAHTVAWTPTEASKTVEVPQPTEPPHEMRIADAAGRPAAKADVPTAFWIWQENGGTLWHVRTMTMKENHRFSGLLSGEEGGPITKIELTRVDWNDNMRGVTKGIAFDFQTDRHEDGFDFVVDGKHCVSFFLRVDRQTNPSLVEIGAANAHPPQSHFKLCP